MSSLVKGFSFAPPLKNNTWPILISIRSVFVFRNTIGPSQHRFTNPRLYYCIHTSYDVPVSEKKTIDRYDECCNLIDMPFLILRRMGKTPSYPNT